MEEKKIRDLLRKAVFSDCYDNNEDETRTLYFDAPKELVADQYPEADGTDIRIQFPLNEPEARAAGVMFGPVKCHANGDKETCDWNNVDLPYEDIEYLMDLASKAMKN